MKWKIHAVGKPALPHARAGVEDYLGRLRHYTSCDLAFAKEGALDDLAARAPKEHPGWRRIVLDERGTLLTTAALAGQVDRWQQESVGGALCFIGGADGHSETLRREADLVLALSPLTFQHELALVIFLEQLYRVYTILRGEPYHR